MTATQTTQISPTTLGLAAADHAIGAARARPEQLAWR